MRRFTLTVAVSLAACGGGGNTPISVAGQSLKPASAEMFSFFGVPSVVLTDVPDFCGKVRASFPQGKGCNTAPSPVMTNPAAVSGSYLTISTLGVADGAKLDIIKADIGTPGPIPASGSMVTFSSLDANDLSKAKLFTAVDGHVDIGTYRASSALNGSYEVTFDNGERVNGHFSAQYCDAYEALDDLASYRACSGSTNPDSCSRTCSCDAKVLSASCTRDGTGSTWTCDCQSASGAFSTCSMGTPDCSSDTGTCCSLLF